MEMELRKEEGNNLDGVNGGFMAMDQYVPNGWNFDYFCFNNPFEEDEKIDHTSSCLMDLISQPPPLLDQLPQPSSPPPPLSLPLSSAFDYHFLEDINEFSFSPPPPLILPASQGNNNNNCSPLEVENVSIRETNKKRSNKNKLEGQPSKNLMAERRRRKRLNDRLSMLRSIVPKITKMDRTSILGDAVDYMKELLDKINKLQELGSNTHLNNLITNESMVRNSPKFEVDQREVNRHIDVRCPTKPGLLLSTVNTLETLGLEIQQCVISCFSDFSLQASCSEAAGQREFVTSGETKQALIRNAGYGGRCL